MRRILLTIIAGFVVLVGGGYTAYWFVTASILERVVADWVDQRRAEGYVVELAAPEVTGFPTAFRMDLGKPLVQAPAALGGWRWQGSTLLAEAQITNPWHILFATPGRHELSAPVAGAMETYTAEAKAAAGEFKLMPSGGGLETAGLDLAGVTLMLPGQEPVRIDEAQLRLVPGPIGAGATAAPAEATANLQLVGVALPPDQVPEGMDSRVDRVELDALLRGLIPPGDPAQALRRWRDGGGVLEVQKLVAEWGPLKLAGDGTFALDKQMQPMGSMSAAIQGLEPAAQQLVQAGLITENQADVVTTASSALERPAAGGGKEVRLALRLQDRTLSMGPFDLMRLPSIDWR